MNEIGENNSLARPRVGRTGACCRRGAVQLNSRRRITWCVMKNDKRTVHIGAHANLHSPKMLRSIQPRTISNQ